MSEWRKARLANSEARQLRLEENKLRKKENSPSPPPASSSTSSNSSSPSTTTTTTTATQETNQLPVKTAPVPETTILTPQPLSPPANDLHEISNNKSQDLNYADFDNDTSSPFDNMLLKSINDKEELAQVAYFYLFNKIMTFFLLLIIIYYFFNIIFRFYNRRIGSHRENWRI